jgi:hypothetical protein
MGIVDCFVRLPQLNVCFQMKKFFPVLLVVFMTSVSTAAFAQLSVDKGTKFANLGLGLGGYGGIGFAGGGVAFTGSFELGIMPNITVGGVASFRSYSNFGSYYSIGPRGSYHFNEILSLSTDKADLYAGIGLIYSGFSYSDSRISSLYSYGGIGFPIHIGGRYFFSENLGGFAEVGYGLAPLSVGVTFKF